MTMDYIEVARIESKSRTGKFYIISKDREGHLSCNCPAWIFKCGKSNKELTGNRRFCKHLKEYLGKIF